MQEFDSEKVELDDLTKRIDQAKNEMDRILAARKELIYAADNETLGRSKQIDADVAHLTASNKALVEHIRLLKGKYAHSPIIRAIENEGNRFQKLTTSHVKEEHAVQGAMKQQIRRQVDIAYGETKSEEEKDAMVNTGGVQAFQAAMMSSRRGAAQNALNNARDRQQEIEKIGQQMEVLLDLFQNMSALVAQQEEHVTKIAENAEQTHVDMEEGVKQLDTGIEKAKSARRKKWWCLLIVVILIIIIVIVIMVVVVKPIIQESNNNKRSLEYLAHARRSIIEGMPTKRSFPPQARRALLE